jgi:hypothetical protein
MLSLKEIFVEEVRSIPKSLFDMILFRTKISLDSSNFDSPEAF